MLIPEILHRPDDTTLVRDEQGNVDFTKQGLVMIRHKKKIGDTLFYVEEIRTGQKQLAPKSMWRVTPPKTE